MQHNAKVTIISNPDQKPSRFWMHSHAEQAKFRKLLRLAMRGQRRRVAVDPEQIAINFFGYAWRLTTVYIYPPLFQPAYRYRIDLLATPPTIHITYPAGDSTKQNLFQYAGEERITREPRKPKNPSIKQGRRGRPSHLQTDPRISPEKRAEMRAELELMLKK